MALGSNGKAFGLDVESRLNKKHSEGGVHSPTGRKVKEPQKERLQMTIQISLKDALQRYADDRDLSMNKVVLDMIQEVLVREGYYK